MAGSAPKSSRRKANAAEDPLYDRELDQFPPEMRWREWMLRVEAVIFASAEPVAREPIPHSSAYGHHLTSSGFGPTDVTIAFAREELLKTAIRLYRAAVGSPAFDPGLESLIPGEGDIGLDHLVGDMMLQLARLAQMHDFDMIQAVYNSLQRAARPE